MSLYAKTLHDELEKQEYLPDTKMYVEVCGVQLELIAFRHEQNGGAIIFMADETTEQHPKDQREGEYDHGEHRTTH